jgi:hypothetical protein
MDIFDIHRLLNHLPEAVEQLRFDEDHSDAIAFMEEIHDALRFCGERSAAYRNMCDSSMPVCSN